MCFRDYKWSSGVAYHHTILKISVGYWPQIQVVMFTCQIGSYPEAPKQEDVFSDDEDLVEDTIDELYDDLLIVLTCRRGVENKILKSIQWCDDILTTMDDNRFRQMLRVDRTQFAHLLSLIENDDVFAKCSGKQFPVDIQLAVVLYRLGFSGESASIRKLRQLLGLVTEER
ncbi:hypothetical protein EVAR_72513_1 [Eumeta japonica]|uniref:Uncharacterized protein n=1 Tax=Eumeta variegata TaxID=151549 RepID=A0A4C1T911_EUMVA|nr:hypothetical protein EVAR_72513_1 [Eumeta japonica]